MKTALFVIVLLLVVFVAGGVLVWRRRAAIDKAISEARTEEDAILEATRKVTGRTGT